MGNTLLEKAKSYKKNSSPHNLNVDEDTVGLCVAWAKGDINKAQIAHALGSTNGIGRKHYMIISHGLAKYLRGLDIT